MIRDLLTPEAHADSYTWAAVLLAHAWIGHTSALFLPVWAVAVAYAAFEVFHISRGGNRWDSVLDWCGVVLGAMGAIPAVWIVCAVGAWARSRREHIKKRLEV